MSTAEPTSIEITHRNLREVAKWCRDRLPTCAAVLVLDSVAGMRPSIAVTGLDPDFPEATTRGWVGDELSIDSRRRGSRKVVVLSARPARTRSVPGRRDHRP